MAAENALRKLGAQICETPWGEGLRLGAPAIAEARAAIEDHTHDVPAWARAIAPGASIVDPMAPSRAKRVDPGLLSPRGDGQKRFLRGRLIHGLLERLPDVAPERRAEAARAWLKRQGAEEQQVDALAREALAVIEDASFASLFGPMSRAEAPIVGEVEGKPVRGVVDRLAVDDAEVIVLDFKTDRPAPASAEATADAYVLQMALYREVMRRIFPGKTVRCALLWTEAPRLMELPQARLDIVFDRFRRG